MAELHLAFLRDRIQLSLLLIVASFVGVLSLSSQSAASWPTYLLALSVILSWRSWDDVLSIPYFRMIGVVVVYFVISGLWSPAFSLSEFGGIVGRGMLILLFIVACAECEHRGELRRWLGRSLAIVATVAACSAIYVQLQIPDHFPGTRLYGLGQLDNPVIAGMVYGAALVIMVDLIWCERQQWWRVMGVLSAAVLIVAILLTDSRSAWLSVSTGVCVYMLAVLVKDRQRFMVTLGVAAVLVGIAFLALYGDESTHSVLFPRGSSYRFDIWQETIARVLSEGSLMWGLGIVTPDQISVGELVFLHPHSLYFSVLFQGGLVGVVLLVLLIVWTLKNLLKHYAHQDAKLGVALFSIALLGYLFDGHELVDKVSDMWFLFWLPVALSLGLTWRSPSAPEDDL